MVPKKENQKISLGAVLFGWPHCTAKAEKALLNCWCSTFMYQAFLGDLKLFGSFYLVD